MHTHTHTAKQRYKTKKGKRNSCCDSEDDKNTCRSFSVHPDVIKKLEFASGKNNIQYKDEAFTEMSDAAAGCMKGLCIRAVC